MKNFKVLEVQQVQNFYQKIMNLTESLNESGSSKNWWKLNCSSFIYINLTKWREKKTATKIQFINCARAQQTLQKRWRIRSGCTSMQSDHRSISFLWANALCLIYKFIPGFPCNHTVQLKGVFNFPSIPVGRLICPLQPHSRLHSNITCNFMIFTLWSPCNPPVFPPKWMESQGAIKF